MRRRQLVLAWPGAMLSVDAASAREPGRPARFAMPLAMPYAAWPRRAAFIDAMRERGWIEGTHFVVDVVQADGSAERMPAVAAELVQRRPDVIVTSGTTSVGPIMKAKATIPIVFHASATRSARVSWPAWRARAAMSPALGGWRSERTPSNSSC